jgi:hypothetical protein
MKLIRLFFLLNFFILWFSSYSMASSNSININGRNYNFNETQCSIVKVNNNNNWKYKLSINFLDSEQNTLNVFVYDNTVNNLLEQWAILWLKYQEICNRFFIWNYCVQANNNKLRVKRTSIDTSSNNFNWNWYLEIRSDINYRNDYYPVQKIYFQCDWIKPYSTNYNNNSNLDYIYNSLSNNWSNGGYTNNGNNSNNVNNSNNSNNVNNSNNTYNNYTYNTYNNTYNYNYYNSNTVTNNDTNISCAKEWEISNPSIWPNNYKPCCVWLRWFNYQNPSLIWAGLMCYDLNKWIPTCQKDWTSFEWRYYTNWDLLKYTNCKININQCTYNSDCQNWYVCNNWNCVIENQNLWCVTVGITYNKNCCSNSTLVKRASDPTNRYCARKRP